MGASSLAQLNLLSSSRLSAMGIPDDRFEDDPPAHLLCRVCVEVLEDALRLSCAREDEICGGESPAPEERGS